MDWPGFPIAGLAFFRRFGVFEVVPSPSECEETFRLLPVSAVSKNKRRQRKEWTFLLGAVDLQTIVRRGHANDRSCYMDISE